jgi:hypothetical protein
MMIRPCGVLGDYRHARKNVKALKEIAETPCWRCFLFRNCGWEMSASLGPLPPPAGAREPAERSCDAGQQALLELAVWCLLFVFLIFLIFDARERERERERESRCARCLHKPEQMFTTREKK